MYKNVSAYNINIVDKRMKYNYVYLNRRNWKVDKIKIQTKK